MRGRADVKFSVDRVVRRESEMRIGMRGRWMELAIKTSLQRRQHCARFDDKQYRRATALLQPKRLRNGCGSRSSAGVSEQFTIVLNFGAQVKLVHLRGSQPAGKPGTWMRKRRCPARSGCVAVSERRGSGRREAGVPHRGWVCVGIEDAGSSNKFVKCARRRKLDLSTSWSTGPTRHRCGCVRWRDGRDYAIAKRREGELRNAQQVER
jgi:hypothetical protein